MTDLELLETTISELSQLIRDRNLSPVELTEACIDRCERGSSELLVKGIRPA